MKLHPHHRITAADVYAVRCLAGALVFLAIAVSAGWGLMVPLAVQPIGSLAWVAGVAVGLLLAPLAAFGVACAFEAVDWARKARWERRDRERDL